MILENGSVLDKTFRLDKKLHLQVVRVTSYDLLILINSITQ